MRVLITGAMGFIGKNLVQRLNEEAEFEILTFNRADGGEYLYEMLTKADVVVHLAGENRPDDPAAFDEVNIGLTQRICKALQVMEKSIPILFASSIHAVQDNPYGRSKFGAEKLLLSLAKRKGNPVAIYRLPGVFGKWARPNYNSVVATFCYNKSRDLPVYISNLDNQVLMVYVDDVINSFLQALKNPWFGVSYPTVGPEYSITLGDLSAQIDAFKNSRVTLISEPVGVGLTRALYATYISYLPVDKFKYDIPTHGDERGVFVEMLKTHDSGQFSFFTARQGVTRGGHYHHTKTEKFLVVKGRARFGFRNVLTNEIHYFETSDEFPEVVETVPGWAHDITNIGIEDMVVMLWANEIFEPRYPDTVYSKV